MRFNPSAVEHATFPVPRLGLNATRVHWFTLFLLVFDLVGVGREWPWWLWPAMVPLFWLGYWVHEAGHYFVARWLRIARLTTVIHLLVGGISDVTLPRRAWPLIAYACAGIVANGILGSLCIFGLVPLLNTWDASGISSKLIGYLGYVCFRQGLFNLALPIYPFDAGLLMRGLLWPVLGIQRAIAVTMFAGYVAIALIFVASFQFQNMLYLVLGVSLLLGLLREHQSIRNGFDPWLQSDPTVFGHNRAIWSKWSKNREVARVLREQKLEEDESVTLDRLLDKVSNEGLPSLTAAERKLLERISKRQRERA